MIGAMRERLDIQRNDPALVQILSVTRLVTIATVTTRTPHGYLATDYVTLTGGTGDSASYNAKWKVTSVPTPTSFTFVCGGSLVTPATGLLTVIYTSNAQGGAGANGSPWRAHVSRVPAEHLPLGARESLQLQAIQSDVTGRFRIRARTDVTPSMRIVWTPSYPRGAATVTMAITGITPYPGNRSYQFLEAAEVSTA